MRRFITALTFIIMNASTIAQDDVSPENRRYLNPIFEEVKLTDNIVFAKKHNAYGNKVEALRMRVFEPKGDSSALRPLFLLMPGGGWVVNGDDWMNDVAAEIAQAGYVVAIHKYRLSKDVGAPKRYFDALAKASSDQRDALQYLIDDANGKNRFNIDIKNIFIGGHSAGAITSMHTAYFDKGDSAQPGLCDAFERHNTLPSKQTQVKLKGVINLAGLLSELSVINRNDIPLLSIHGDLDAVVTPDRDENVFGSTAIHEYANTVGTYSRLFLIEGARHNDTAIPRLCEECVPIIKRFMYNQLDQTNRKSL